MWQGDVGLGDALIISLTGMLVVMFELMIIALFIVLLSKIIGMFGKKKNNTVKDEKKAVPPVQAPAAQEQQTGTDSSGEIAFEGISSEEAAVIMSAVSAESGTPLDKIKFKSIKKI
jgi:Na+-transporting methylmalonyl-CoA/oxaloacetate decarboxylase gamma subunit